jgi:Mn-dependent DtxR family transcriptional regulator
MTEARQAVYDALVRLTEANGQPPTVRELARTLDIGPTTAAWHVRQLRDLGLVEWTAKPGGREPGQARAVRQAEDNNAS